MRLTYHLFISFLFLTLVGQAQELENLGPGINSPLREQAPIISPDGKTLYFMRYGHQSNAGIADIWVSTLDSNGTWSKAKITDRSPLNQFAYNQVMSVTPNGNAVMIRNNRGYAMVRKTKDGWGTPEILNISSYETLNRLEVYSAFLSNDGTTLILSFSTGERPIHLDLYYSKKTTQGSWSRPRLLGNANTQKNEFSPFLASDNRTLYFSSDRPGSLGAYDIYVTKRIGPSWTQWSEPQNLGAPINTSGSEKYFSLPAKGDLAYVCSTHEGEGDYDIFRTKLKEGTTPDPVIIVEGVVRDEYTQQPIGSKILYYNLKNGRPLGTANSNPITGEYKIILPYGQSYSFRAESAGYIGASSNVDLDTIKEYSIQYQDLNLIPLSQKEIKLVVNNIFFESGESTLKRESFPELIRLSRLLLEHPKKQLTILGHTDNVGDHSDNLLLSKERAEAVMNYLQSKQIPSHRMKAKGLGETQPIVPNTSNQHRQLNRRVEFILFTPE